MNPGNLRADRALSHCTVEGILGRYKGVCGAIVAIDAVHHSPLTLWFFAFQRGSGEGGLRTIGIAALHPWNRGARRIGRDVFDVAQVNAVDSCEVRQ